MSEVVELCVAAERPAHIPVSHVYDFDLFRDPQLKLRGYERIEEIVRDTPSVFWTPRNGGHWLIRGFQAVREASRDHVHFSSEFVPYEEIKAMAAALPEGAPNILQPVPISVDPPIHTKFRAPLNTAFSPSTVLGMKESIRAMAIELVEAVRGKGGCEFVSEIAEPFPVTIFLDMLGLPIERQREYREVAQEHLASVSNPTPDGVQQRMRKLVSVMSDVIEARRIEPRDDLLSRLWQLEIDGKPMTLNDIENFAVVLFIGGLDTVVNALGHGIRHLAIDQDLQDRLRTDPAALPMASEEILRRYTFTVPPRVVARDIEFHGVTMKKGERVFLFLPGADLDPAKFVQPGTYNLERETNSHVAFGNGPHRCVGMHLARMELQVFYSEFLARVPRFRLDPGRPVEYHSGHVIGPDCLHLIWDV